MARRRIAIGSGVVLLGASVGACSTTMEIAVSGSLERPMITFSRSGGHPKRVCLDRVAVYEVDAPAPRSPAWQVGDVESECVEVASVTYGAAPRGLPTRAGPAPLKPDTPYEFFGSGWTRETPNIPWYGGGAGARVVFRDGAWRPAPRETD